MSDGAHGMSSWAHRAMGKWWCGLSWHGSCGFVWRDASCSGALCKWNRFERGASWEGALYEWNRFVYPLAS